MDIGADQQSGRGTRLSVILAMVGALTALAGEKLGLIATFGTDVPTGDQWYGELVALYAPLARGEFGLRELFAAHNEHHIVWTRLLNLTLLKLNGHWDPRVQMVVSAGMLLAFAGVLLAFVARRVTSLGLVLTGALAVLVFGNAALWENTLCGFQSSFYFLLLFALLHVLGTLFAPARSWRWWGGHATGVAALFAMAAGPVSAAAVAATLAWRRFVTGRWAAGERFALGWNVVLVAVGALLLPRGGGEPTATAGLAERAEAFLHLLSWPVAEWPAGFALWAPAGAYLLWTIVRPRDEGRPAWLLPLVLLALGFTVAILLGRGGIASRYGELFGLGVVVNFLCLAAWPARGRRGMALVCFGTLWVGALLFGLNKQVNFALGGTLQDQVAREEQLAADVRRFVVLGDDAAMRANAAFQGWRVSDFTLALAQPGVGALLPLSVRAPLGMEGDRDFGGKAWPVSPEVAGLPARVATSVTWRSGWLESRLPWIGIHVSGRLAPPGSELHLESENGAVVRPLQARIDAPGRWQRVNFPAPTGKFRVVARSSDGERFAFTAPREFGSATRQIPKVLQAAKPLRFAGWLALAGAGLAALALWVREDKDERAAV